MDTLNRWPIKDACQTERGDERDISDKISRTHSEYDKRMHTDSDSRSDMSPSYDPSFRNQSRESMNIDALSPISPATTKPMSNFFRKNFKVIRPMIQTKAEYNFDRDEY